MIITNTVLKLNIKGHGDSLVWLYPQGNIRDKDVEDCFPHINAEHYGPNVAFTGNRISTKAMLLTTTSTWGSADEFGRRGITLSQGILFEDEGSKTEKTYETYTSFEALIRLHKARYQDLQSILQYLAKQGTVEEGRNLANEIFISLTEAKAGSNLQLFRYLTEYLRSVLHQQNTKLRVSTKFPWSEELGFFSLIGLQTDVDKIRSIGGGDIASFESYQHIAVLYDIPGYQYVDLNRQLISQVSGNNLMQNPLFQDGKNSDTSSTGDNKLWRKTVENAFYIANMPIASTFLILCLGVFLIWSLSKDTNRTGSVTTNPPSVVERATPMPSALPISPAPNLTESTSTLDKTIAQLYDANRKTRQAAFSTLIQDTASHAEMVPRALTYALNHSDQINGLLNTNEILKRCDPALLEKNDEAYNKFLTLINNIQSKSAAGSRERGRRTPGRRARPPARTQPTPNTAQPTPPIP